MSGTAIPTQLGEFRPVAILGRGGSGIVYDAMWGPRRVALKVLHRELASTARVREQFLAEAKRLQAITHPAVVKVLAVGELPDELRTPYLAMERLDGEPLASVLARGPLPVPRAIALFAGLCDAVGALHAEGVIHRDLKPENVLVVEGDHAVLLDFGIAKDLEAPASTTTMEGNVRGTPAYMAPERFFGQPAGVTTDIYELAVMLYAMLAGRLPWDDLADPEARLSPQPLPELGELDVVIRQALSTRAQNRPATARALLDAVHAAAGTQASAPKPADTARMAPATEQKPWFAERHTTTDRGKTPLAWAPADAPAKPAVARRSRRWPLALAMVAVAGAAAAVVAWRTAGDDDPVAIEPASVISPHVPKPEVAVDAIVASTDPWDQPPPPPPKPPPTIELSGPEVPTVDARKELAAAYQHVPADTRVLFGVNLGELRKHDQFDDILGKIKRQPMVVSLIGSTPPCVQSVLTGAEWALYASKSLEDSEHATLIVRGRWKRADIARCFADDAVALAMPDGKTMLQLRRVGWIDFIDDHTLYLSVRDDLAAAQVHDLVKTGGGPMAHAKQLVAKLPADRTVAVVVDGSDELAWPKDHLPKGSDLAAYVRVDNYTELDIRADTHTVEGATKVVNEVKAVFGDLFKDKDSDFLGSLQVVRDGTALRIHGRLSSLLIAMISSAIP
ncbi:MAG: serine/threonine-protein kinase [Kofleriaceae bacterium]